MFARGERMSQKLMSISEAKELGGLFPGTKRKQFDLLSGLPDKKKKKR